MGLFRRRRRVPVEPRGGGAPPSAPPSPEPTAQRDDDRPTLRSADDLLRFEQWLAERRDGDDAVAFVAARWHDESADWKDPATRRALQETILRFLATEPPDADRA